MHKPIAAAVVGFVATALFATSTAVATAATSTATSTCTAIDAPKAMNDLPASADCNEDTATTGGIHSNATAAAVTPVAPTSPISATPLPFDRTNGDILAITKIDGTNNIAFGGNFSLVFTPDGISHPAASFAVVNQATGAMVYAGNPSNATTPADIYVRSIASFNGTIYMGGDFTAWDGVPRVHAASLSPSFAVTAWNPAPSGTIRGMATDGAGVYMGGDMAVAEGVNTTTGALLWSKAVTGGSVHAVMFDQGAVFVGGLFEVYDGVTQHGLVKVTPSTGAVITAFNANLRADTGVGADGDFDGEDIIAMSVGPNNGQIFIGSGGHANPGLSSNETILTNITTGARIWKYSTIGDTQAIGAVGDTVVAGYHNNGADQNNPLSANHFGIQIEDSNGVPTTWDPLINGNQDNADGGNNGVQAIYVDPVNDILYLAGAFEHWNGTTGLTHASLIAFSYTPSTATAPGAPTGVAAVAGNGNANVSWTAPVSSGGSPITGYTVTSSPGGFTATAPTATPVTVSGLTNGTSYTFTVKATNAVGTGPASSPSAAVSPAAGGGLSNSAEGGTSGTSVTVSNSGGGSGDAFTVVNKGAGAALVYSPTVPAHGALGYSLTTTSGTATDVGWSGFNATSMAARFYFNPGSTLPSTLLRLVDIRNASGTAARVMLSATNQVLVQNNAGSTVTTFAHALAPNTWYRIEVAISASPTVGTINAAYFLGDAATPVDPAFATTSANTGSANLTQVMVGSAASSTFTGTMFLDDVAVQPASTSFIGKATAPSVPGAPTAVTAVAGNSSAVVSWGAPASNGSPISSYSITSSPAGFTGTAAGSATSVNATGLTNGNAYTFTVTATNGVGPGPASAPSAPVTPAVAPGAPTAVTAVGANTSATVSWSAPSSNGGSPISSYLVTSSPGGLTATTSGTSVAVTGLTNGTPYTFTVVATNAVGPGPASGPSNAVTPAPTAPTAPTTVSAVAGDSSATVSWSAPTSDGGSAITGYTVTSSPGGLTATTAGATTVPVTGLTNGTSYTFTVVAMNGVGTGPSSTASNSVTPVSAPTAPGAPTGVTAVPGNASATVSWTAPVSNGGSPITGYTVTSSPGGLTGTTTGATTVAVSGLTNGTAYTFTVVATNNVGTGPASPPSAPVTPTPPSGSLSNSAEGGTSGTAVSTANSGGASGNALTVVNRGSGATLNFTSAAHAHGALAYTITGKSGTQTDVGWNGQSTTSMAARFYYNPGSSLPNTVMRLADIRNASGTAARVELSAANQIFIQNNAGSTVATFSHALQANTWYRIELAISVSTTTATIKAAYYAADSTTPIDPMFSTTTGNTGSANLTQVLFGSTASATWTGTSFFDDLAMSPSTTLFIGPVAAAPTAPGAPTGVSAVAGDGSATVSWTAPVSNGGSAITGYTVTSSPGGFTATTAGATSVVVSGLTNGTTYQFFVVASNVIGSSPSSAPSNAVTPIAAATAPGAPTAVSAVGGNGSATVSWTPPASDGGSAITGYTVTSSPGALTATTAGGATSVVVPGLTNGTSYQFFVVASNVVGSSPSSVPSNAVIPAPVAPGAPTGVSAVAGDGSATVSWTAPASDGGSAITNYTVTSSPGNVTASTAGTSVVVNGLTNNTQYTFSVVATNGVGDGPASAPSAGVTPTAAATVPGAPTGVTATPGDSSASVSWTAPASDGGSAITGYTVTVVQGGATFHPVGAATTVNVTGLTNGTSYTFTVVASNSVGAGPASDPSDPVTPVAAPPTAPGAPTGVSAVAGDSSATVSWTAPASDGGSAITGYTVTASPGGATFHPVGTATSVNATGLTNNTAYTFTVVATNGVGDGPASSPSNQVTPTAAVTPPGAPTLVTATAGNGSATVSWTAPSSNGGAAITGYTVTSSPGALTATTGGTTSTTVLGLTNGTSYTFTVVASNSAGPGPASAPSSAVTPVAPAGALSNTAEGGTAGTSVTAANSGGGSGNAFNVVNKGTGAALVYSTTAAHGTRGYGLTGTSGTSTFMGWNALSATSAAVRFYYNTGSTLPNSVLRLADIRNASATAARVELSATNQVFIQNAAGSTVTTFSHALQANTWYRIELTISVSASGATIKAAYYLGDSTTPVDPAYATATGNTGTANITQVSIGSTASATWVGTSFFDDLAIQSGSTTFIGPSSP